MPKKPSDYPLFHLRMPEGLYTWLKDDSKRTGRPMAAIIKDSLEQLKRTDLRDRRK